MTKKSVAAFLLGTAVSMTAAWYLMKKKYQKLAQEEINEMKEAYKEKLHQMNEKTGGVLPVVEKEDKNIYNRMPKSERTDYNRCSTTDRSEPITKAIDPGEFLSDNGYEKVSLDYYAGDETLALDEQIIDTEIIGAANLERFKNENTGMRQQPFMYLRNKKEEIDYELIFHNDCFTEDS